LRYSIFDSALYRNLEAKWLFPQEKATFLDLGRNKNANSTKQRSGGRRPGPEGHPD
jgi:hypothetical protein